MYLLDKIVAFCENSGYSYEFEKNKFYGAPFEVNEMISWEGVKDYVKSITNLNQEIIRLMLYMMH